VLALLAREVSPRGQPRNIGSTPHFRHRPGEPMLDA
jgi:hypothetical protein